MLGDILLITEKHPLAGGQIVERLRDMNVHKYVLAIGGESGSGKSELAHVISRQLKDAGQLTKILHTDNYYKISPALRTAWRKEHGIQSVGWDEYDWDLIHKNIQEFREGKEAILPCIDLLTDQEDRLITNFEGIDFLVLEGLYPLKAEVDLRIFINLTYQETHKAQIMRNKEPQNAFRMQILHREHEIVQSLRPLADLLITKDFTVVEV